MLLLVYKFLFIAFSVLGKTHTQLKTKQKLLYFASKSAAGNFIILFRVFSSCLAQKMHENTVTLCKPVKIHENASKYTIRADRTGQYRRPPKPGCAAGSR